MLGRALELSSPQFEFRGNDDNAMTLVRQLVVSAGQMPSFARQTRRRLSPVALRVREQLLSATDPTKLLFEDLPTACGVNLHGSKSASQFVDVLTRSMGEITSAYAKLLDEIESMIRGAFGLATEVGLAERQLRQIAEPLLSYGTDPRMQVFLREAARDHSNRDWRESIARAINGGLPPTHWKDSDVLACQTRVVELRNDVARLEEMATELHRSGANRVVRFSLLEVAGSELNEVVSLRVSDDIEIEALVKGLAEVLWQNTEESEDARRVRLEALGRVTADLLAESHNRVKS
jgi:hypothetical protein